MTSHFTGEATRPYYNYSYSLLDSVPFAKVRTPAVCQLYNILSPFSSHVQITEAAEFIEQLLLSSFLEIPNKDKL